MENAKEGSLAPDFDLPGDGGLPVRLTDLRGRKVVLYFYPQDDTETCTLEAIDFSAKAKDFERAGAAIVGISPDPPKSHDRFKAKHGLDLTLVSDVDRKTIEDYGLWVEKTTFGRTYMGVERATFLIDAEGRIARVWHKVRIKGHVEQVLQAVKAL